MTAAIQFRLGLVRLLAVRSAPGAGRKPAGDDKPVNDSGAISPPAGLDWVRFCERDEADSAGTNVPAKPGRISE
jgi:hypothetical protein